MTFRYDFTRLTTREHLLRALGLPDFMFDHVLEFMPPPDPEPAGASEPTEISALPAFFRHKIPKRNRARGYRIAWEPVFLAKEYRALSIWLAQFLKQELEAFPPPTVFGYVGGRNIKGNAGAHCGHEFLLVVDLVDFFPSITRSRIEALFLDIGIAGEVADQLSRFVTIGGALPLGLATSPVLSNAIFLPVDVELQALAAACGATYTRYSDDLSFSGDADLPDIEEITSALAKHGFAVALPKVRRSRRGRAHFVTGLSISDPEQPHVPAGKKRRLRQELYYAKKFGLNDHFRHQGVNDAQVIQQEINRLDGQVKFVAFHEPKLSSRIKPLWSDVLREAGERPSFTPRKQHRHPFCISVDETELQAPYGPVLALALSVSQHEDRVRASAREVLEESLSDPFAAGNRDAILKRGLHFSDATPDLRQSYAMRLQTMPFEGYVVMGPLASPDQYEATYLRLLRAVLKRRLMAAESQFALFVIEKNGKVSEAKVKALIADVLGQLKAENNRRPQSVAVEFAAKPHPGISVPDFLLGILAVYLRSDPATVGRPEPRDRLMFERLRHKYRLILDVDPWTEYSRRNPIAPWNS